MFGLFASALTSPQAAIAALGVLLTDGRPVFYTLPVGFLGKDFEIINKTKIPKIRSLHRLADQEVPLPFESTVFQGSRQKITPDIDPRAHQVGRKLRQSGNDEIPQLWEILRGNMTGIGPRAYYRDELRDLETIFAYFPKFLPEIVRTEYLQTMSKFRPRPGLVGLYSATYRKNLTVSERLWLDIFELTHQNPIGDFHITMQTIKTTRQHIGAR